MMPFILSLALAFSAFVANPAQYIQSAYTAPAASASVAFDAVGPGTGTGCLSNNGAWTTFTCTWSHTVSGSGSGHALCVGAAYSPAQSDIATLTATYAGSALTSEGWVYANNVSTAGLAQLFCTASPATGTNSVVITATYVSGTKNSADAIVGGSISFTGATGFGAAVTAHGNGTAPSAAVSSASGHMVLDVVGTGTSVTSSSQTLRWKDNFTTNSGSGNAAQSTAAGASSVTMGYTVSSDYWGIVAIDVQ